MKPEQLIAALCLPPAAQVGQRIPKKMLADHAANTSADSKLLHNHIEDLNWVAALKPVNAGIPAYRDTQRSYLELAVLQADLRPGTPVAPKPRRVAELIHRAIPYPVLLVQNDEQRLEQVLHVSLGHIRHAANDADATVLDGELLHISLGPQTPHLSDLLAALDLSCQPRAHLLALYQGWIDTLCAWQAATVTGHFAASASPAQAIERRAALRRYRELDAQIASLRASARQEKQIARQVALNLDIKALEAQRQQAAKNL